MLYPNGDDDHSLLAYKPGVDQLVAAYYGVTRQEFTDATVEVEQSKGFTPLRVSRDGE